MNSEDTNWCARVPSQESSGAVGFDSQTQVTVEQRRHCEKRSRRFAFAILKADSIRAETPSQRRQERRPVNGGHVTARLADWSSLRAEMQGRKKRRGCMHMPRRFAYTAGKGRARKSERTAGCPINGFRRFAAYRLKMYSTSATIPSTINTLTSDGSISVPSRIHGNPHGGSSSHEKSSTSRRHSSAITAANAPTVIATVRRG